MNPQVDIFLRSATWRVDHSNPAQSFVGRPVKSMDNVVYDWMGPFPKDVADWILDAIVRKQQQDRSNPQ